MTGQSGAKGVRLSNSVRLSTTSERRSYVTLPVMIGLIDILKIAGFDPALPTRLVRHNGDIADQARREGELELFQSYQAKARFRGVQQIVSFYGLAGTRAAAYRTGR